jgi:hypothetical protein
MAACDDAETAAAADGSTADAGSAEPDTSVGPDTSVETEADVGPLPAFAELPPRPAPPPVLEMLDGTPVGDVGMWRASRRPELLRLFEHYIYGFAPATLPVVRVEPIDEDPAALDGAATRTLVRLHHGPEGTPPVDLLLVTPNAVRPAPVFVGANFFGNHTTTDDPAVPLAAGWVPERGVGVEDNRATEASRGTSAERWPFRDVVARGYGVATFYHGDLQPDRDAEGEGVRASYPSPTGDPDHDWGAISAWAFGLSRAVDFLAAHDAVDPARIAAIGHSRNGKAALLAAARDDRIALVVSNMSGCLGAALSRRRFGETIERITTVFPWWWPPAALAFADNEDRLPVDQHLLLALSAPRPVLVISGARDAWADPEGEFESARLAGPAWALHDLEPMAADAPFPEVGAPRLDTPVGYARIAGGHDIGAESWRIAFDFADRWLARD